MASIRKFRDKWRAEIRRQGHKPMSKMFAKKGAASKWARETETALEKGDIHNLSNKNLSALIDRYFEEFPDTITYEKNVLEFWREQLGKVKLSQVRKAHIVEARKKLRRQKVKTGPNKGKALSHASINRRVALLSRVCAIAVEEWDWLKENPCHIRSLTEDNERDRLLTKSERKALAKALEKYPEQSLLGFVLVAEATGMRAGEIRNLTWRDVDTDTGFIQITKSKNNEKRAVAVTGRALEWLKEWKKDNALRGGGYIFFNSTTGQAPYNYRVHWGDVKTIAGIEDFRFHDLRHGFVTSALQAGMNPVMVQLVSGHKSSQMLKRYAHLVGDVALQVSKAVEGKNNGEG
jgi:integrase